MRGVNEKLSNEGTLLLERLFKFEENFARRITFKQKHYFNFLFFSILLLLPLTFTIGF